MFLLFVGFLSSFSLPFSGFLFCFLFRCFLFSFSFFASFSSFILFFLGLSFICFVLSSFFGLFFSSLFSSSLPLSLILLFVPVLVSSSFSSDPSFLASFSTFSSLSTPLAFPSLPPLSSHPFSLFLFRLRFFPSALFLPSCWLFFLLVCPRCLFGEFLFFLFVFLAFGFRFLSVCVLGSSPLLVLVFSVPGFSFRSCVSFFSPHFSWAPSCAFASPVFF